MIPFKQGLAALSPEAQVAWINSRVEELERHDQAATQDAVFFRKRMVEAEAEVSRLREALEQIADADDQLWREVHESDFARAALSEEPQ